MKCPNCDQENRGIARFCQYCGASLAAQAEEPPVPLAEERDSGQGPPRIADQDQASLGAEATTTEAASQEMPPDEDNIPSHGAEAKMPASEEMDASGDAHLDDLAPDSPGSKEPDKKSSPDVSAPGTDLDRPESQARVAQDRESRDAQDLQAEPLSLEEPDILPPEEATTEATTDATTDATADITADVIPEMEEHIDTDEPLVEMGELAAAGLLPWDERTEPAQASLKALEPGSVVDGRYQVIEVMQSAEQETWYSVRDLARCPRCGSTENSPDEAFCVSCGALMEQKPVATMLERAAPGDVEPDNAQAADHVRYQDRYYWVWQKMEQEQLDTPLPMRMVVGQLSDTGQMRELDEDSLFVLSMASTYVATPHWLGLFVVADGIGGHEGGEIASRIAIQHLAQSMVAGILTPELAGASLAQAAILDQLERAVHAANDRVYLERQKRGNDMGTTLTVALVVDWMLYLAHVGDCRAYRWGQDGLQQLTTDHSIVAGMVAAGTIEPDQIYTHPQRSVIYRSIGDHPAVEVDLSAHELSPDDRIAICSDGLWEMIRSEGIEDVLLQEADPQAACEIMVEQANRAGGSDNISVIIVQF